MKRILGIDTGTNSLGWAVVERLEDETYQLIKKGSLIFQEGVKIEKGIESSKAAERTGYRSLRRQYFRRRLRKIEVLKVLIKYGWCPYISSEDLQLWHTKKQYPKSDEFMLWQRTNDNENKNPYYYRHLCLHTELNLNNKEDAYILGRSIYHLSQRRGFLSNRLDNNSDSEESGKVKKAISDLSTEMQKSNCEYLGDYFYKLYESNVPKKIRGHYTDREEHYKKEFYAICKKQHLSNEMVKDLEYSLYFQRPLKSQRQGVGKCTMEKGKLRCADSHPEFEEYRLLCLINNIKVKSQSDTELRNLNQEEINKITHLFFRKSKPNFDFEEIAKAIAGKDNYQNIKDSCNKPYKFNYRMSQSVSGCPTIAQFKTIFGEDWKNGIAESYTLNTKSDSTLKSVDEMVNDVWNVLYSFSDEKKLVDFAKDKLQLNEEDSVKFSNIRLTNGFANLSLRAIRKITPFLKMRMIYPHAVILANIPTIIGKEIWERDKQNIISELLSFISNFNSKDNEMQGTLDFCIKDMLKNWYDLKPGVTEKLYHPSMIETYQDAKIINGVYQLGSPRTNAVRNPMAMRSLHQIRKVVNQLLKEKIIDNKTEVHIEYARELNDANMRSAIGKYNKNRENGRRKAFEEIQRLYKEETNLEITPTDDDILKYQLWEEQEHICLYTGNQIGISDFIGVNPKYDLEHTIPQSVGGDFTQMNLTLCESHFNRNVKKAHIPSQLSNHEDILNRIQPWKDKIENLTKEIDIQKRKSKACTTKETKDAVIQKRHLFEIERDYWVGKYQRFIMTEVPEGFARRQGAGIGLISKYAGLYLKSLFHDINNRNRTNVFVVKGTATAEFRKMWGIQQEYEKKSRDNHVHHCIDAITIACIGINAYNQIAKFHQQNEEYKIGKKEKPVFPKPWATFTEDMKDLENKILVVHSTPDNMPKRTRKRIKTNKGEFIATGDTARGKLHNETYYGAIEREGEIKYVQRISLSNFKESNVKDIVDDVVRNKIENVIKEKGFKEAIASDIYMNEEKGIRINKVRCYTSVKSPINIRQHRDVSKKEYKQQFHVTNDSNYMMAIYEDIVKDKIKRDYKLIRNIDAAINYSANMGCKNPMDIVPEISPKGFPLKCILQIGTQVLLYEKNKDEINFDDIPDLRKRLYKIIGLSNLPVGKGFGVIKLRHNQEARSAGELKTKNGEYKNGEEYRALIIMLHSQINALIEGQDFIINELGKITLK